MSNSGTDSDFTSFVTDNDIVNVNKDLDLSDISVSRENTAELTDFDRLSI